MNENDSASPHRLTSTQSIEVRAEVGAALRAARLKRGQSLEAVAQQTRIPKRYLEALEAGRLDDFPAFVYMRGFLQGYCDHLDVPFAELWAKVSPPADSAPAAPVPAAPRPSAPDSPGAPSREGSSAAGAIIFALALAAALAVWLFRGPRPPAGSARAVQSTPRALMPVSRAVESKVVLRAIDDAWVRVAVDGDVVFEGRIPRGAAMDWKPKRAVSLRTTAANSLQLSINGAPQALANPTPDGEYRIDVP